MPNDTHRRGTTTQCSSRAVQAYTREVAVLPRLAQGEEDRLALQATRARRRWLKALLREPMVVDELVAILRLAGHGRIRADLAATSGSVEAAAEVAASLDRQHRSAVAFADRAESLRPGPAALAARRRALRARVQASRTALAVDLPDPVLVWLCALVESVGPAATITRIEAARASERRALAALVEANLHLVATVVRSFRADRSQFADLVQEGSLGLLAAAARYEPGRGARFSTYARYWIRRAVATAVLCTDRLIRSPASVAEDARRLLQAGRALAQEFGREPRAEEIAARAGLHPSRARTVLDARLPALSLDAAAEPSSPGSLADTLADSGDTPLDRLEREERSALVAALLKALPPHQERILRARFGLDGSDEPKALESVGTSLGLSRERVRQAEAAAFARMRSRYDAVVLTCRKRNGKRSRLLRVPL